MRRYYLKEREMIKETEAIICNRCGKEIVVRNGEPREGVFSADCEWGYFSEKDGERHHFDLCEECYDGVTREFLIEADKEERTELKIKTKRMDRKINVRCMFVGMRRDDAASLSLSDGAYDAV